jgi:tetratricopeptide (TPR) repeat protein
MLDETLALLEPLPPGPEHVAVLTEISGEHNQRGRAQAGLEVADRALALAAELGLGRPARTLGYRGANRRVLGDAGAGEDFRDALEIALAAGQVRHASTIYMNWASHRAMFEGPAQALETLDEGIALCRARGLTARVNFMTPARMNHLLTVGEFDQVLQVAEGIAERARREHNSPLLVSAYGFQADVLLLRGQADRLAAVPEELEAGIEIDTPPGEKGARVVVAARIRAGLGDREAAIALLRQAADEGLAAGRVVEITVELGEPDLAERLAGPWKDGIWKVYNDALIAEARGDLQTAAGLYPQILDEIRASRNVFYMAKMLVGHGRVLSRLGRSSEAAEALNEVRPILVKLEAAPLLAETDALLRQLTALSA